MTTRFSVRLNKEQLVFSAAHFITYGDDICERLHGHNYRVEVEIEGPLGDHAYVVDFIALKEALFTIVQRLDHHVLLPTGHPSISVQQDGREITAKFRDRRWVFPVEDCVLLPLANTTAELLADWILDQLAAQIVDLGGKGIQNIRVSVDENHGQWARASRTHM